MGGQKKRVAFVHAARHVDAIWEPPRCGVQLGPLLMASLLRERGHEVVYLDESVRDESWDKRAMSIRRLHPGQRGIEEVPYDRTWEELQHEKMHDFRTMDARAFVDKWSVFKSDGSVERYMARVGISEDETIQHLRSLRLDVVGIPLAPSANYLSATSLGRRIKRELPGVKVVMGGQHITANPESFVRDNPWVDHVTEGDAITTIEKLVEGRYLTKIVPGGFQPMEEYPLMDCSLFANAGYSQPPNHNFPSGLKCVDWMASRGCYRDCAFCFAGRKEQVVTQSGWSRIRTQLDHFIAHSFEEIVLQDDAILYQAKKFFLPLIEEMKQRGLSFSDNGGIEFESFTSEIAAAIESYNADPRPGRCVSLYVPFNPRGWNEKATAAGSMIKRYHKHLENLTRARAAGVYVFTSLIVGTPDQTRESFEEDLAVLRGLIQAGYLDSALPLSATMLPGTEWYTRNGHNIIHPDDWMGFNLFSTHHRTDHLSPRDIEECMVHAVQALSDVQAIAAWQCAFA